MFIPAAKPRHKFRSSKPRRNETNFCISVVVPTIIRLKFEFRLYDVTSTYFEGQAEGNAKAARGYLRDQRPDCQQVNLGLVVTHEGLPIGYEVFAGNTANVTTVGDMVNLLEQKYGRARRIWVLDRGMISEANLDLLRGREARYLSARPRASSKRSQPNSWTRNTGRKRSRESKLN